VRPGPAKYNTWWQRLQLNLFLQPGVLQQFVNTVPQKHVYCFLFYPRCLLPMTSFQAIRIVGFLRQKMTRTGCCLPVAGGLPWLWQKGLENNRPFLVLNKLRRLLFAEALS